MELLLRSCMRPSLTKSDSHPSFFLSPPCCLAHLSAFPITNQCPPLLAESPSCEPLPERVVDSRDPAVSLFSFFYFFFWSCCSAVESPVTPALCLWAAALPSCLPDLETETHVGMKFKEAGLAWECCVVMTTPPCLHLEFCPCWVLWANTWGELGFFVSAVCTLSLFHHSLE